MKTSLYTRQVADKSLNDTNTEISPTRKFHAQCNNVASAFRQIREVTDQHYVAENIGVGEQKRQSRYKYRKYGFFFFLFLAFFGF